MTNVAVHPRSISKVTAIELLQLRINLGREDTLVSETLKRNPKTTKARKKVNEPQLDRHPCESTLSCDWALSFVISQTRPREFRGAE